MSVAFVEKMDMILRLFDGDISLTELLAFDVPSQRAIVQARLTNLRRSQEAFENGKVDAYSRRYASTMGVGGGSSTSISYSASSPSSDSNTGQGKDIIDRSNSMNAKDYF